MINQPLRRFPSSFILFASACFASVLQGAPPAASWEFDSEEATPLPAHGGVHRDVAGPRPPEFPDFEPSNTAAKLDGGGARFTIADPGPQSPFDFTQGDSLTLEAWVNVDDLRSGENIYVIGKGRTGAPGFARDNQNWALRLRGARGKACVSFLFATPPAAGVAKSDDHWHRWTTTDGFALKTGWHHIAAAYKFGEPESVRGWIDGKPVKGVWDMGGPTRDAPVVDDDAVWIGSSQGGAAGSSFRGKLDSIAVHRAILDDKTMAARFKRVGEPIVAKPAAETPPQLGALPVGRVLATFHEDMPSHDRWLMEDEKWPAELTRWEGDVFLLPRLPVRYDAWGIRDSWKAPVAVRLAADVQLPPGKNTLLLRARGLTRLWVDGVVVARTKPLTGSPSGEEPITPVAEPPLPGLRPAGHREQEERVEIEVGATGRSRIVVEAMAGGVKFRAEPGELCVAVLSPDGKSYDLLQPAESKKPATPLTDEAVTAALADVECSLSAMDDAVRRTAAASRDEYWNRRHEAARAWVGRQASLSPPAASAQVGNQIDAFLAAKLDRAVAAAARTPVEEAKHFHSQVLPILRSECFRCHGDKGQGGLRLDSRAAVLKGGDSETPAVVPGDVASSELVRRIRSNEEFERMPPTGAGLKPEQIEILESWIKAGAKWPAAPLDAEQVAVAPIVDDAAFLRRAHLDTVGVPPSEREVRDFLADRSKDKRERLIDRLLDDERWADHWMGYWQDVLAENPTLVNATLNSTGPFRWFLYDSLRDGKPLDRMVTELILLRGSQHDGGSAGFGMAAQDDAPLAAKGHILATAFLGVEMQCARCHDSPYHSTKQRDLYSLAAMMDRKTVTVPKTSSVPPAFFENKPRESLIRVTLKPNEPIAPEWPFAAATGVSEADLPADMFDDPKDSRERLAALITAPENRRFAQVTVNRIWRRLMGAGLVEPAHDWEGRVPSHPDLLEWLAREFVANDYDVKHVSRLVMNSAAYQREAVGKNLTAEADSRFFNAPDRRRLSAEQVIDSFYAAAGQPIEIEELTLDPDGRRSASNRQSLGRVRRAWMLVSLSNERDRPSLTLPRASVVSEAMEAFGWSAARQTPRSDRETAPSVLQPGVLANSPLSVWLTRAADGSTLAETAVTAQSPEQLVETVFVRFLGRLPTDRERATFAAALGDGFADRLVPKDEVRAPPPPERLPRVTWSNHLRSEANVIQQEWERRARLGPPADPRLRTAWREAYEDFVWSVVNLREFVWIP